MAYHETACGQICSGKDNGDETEGEDESGHEFNHARSILLVPRGHIDDRDCSTSECKNGSCHEAAEEDFVNTHAGFYRSHARCYLSGLLGSVCIVDNLHRLIVWESRGHGGMLVQESKNDVNV